MGKKEKNHQNETWAVGREIRGKKGRTLGFEPAQCVLMSTAKHLDGRVVQTTTGPVDGNDVSYCQSL